MNYLVKVRGLLNHIVYLLINLFLPANKKNNPRTLLIIRLDRIGDYILFRNFLSAVRTSKKFSDYKITLCGNIVWKNLTETFDKEIVDGFIWVNRDKFYLNFIYKYKLLRRINNYGFETVIEATHSREILFGDAIVNAANAKNRIASTGSGEAFTAWKRKVLTNKLYSQLIHISNDKLFEFEINKEMFNRILDEKLDIKKPWIDTSLVNYNISAIDYILLFPGSNDFSKMWSSKNFKSVADFIITNTHFNIAVSGSKQEAYLFNEIAGSKTRDRFYNLFGSALPELAKLIADAALLISNDTSAIHFAVAVDTPFICISNGNHFGRFHPYPKDIYDKGHYIYPPEIMNNINNTDMLKGKYRFNSDLDINKIEPKVVKNLLMEILK